MAAKVMLSQGFRLNFVKCFTRNVLLGRLTGAETNFAVQRFYSSSDSEDEYVYGYTTEEETIDIDKLRDVSRLPKRFHAQMDHSLDVKYLMDEDKAFGRFTQRRDYQRRQYAQFGEATGIDAGIMWPTKEELAEMKEEEAEFEPTLQERWELLAEEKDRILAEDLEKDALIAKRMKEMPALIQKYKDSLKVKAEKDSELEKKQSALVEEARDYFGFYLDFRDVRMKEFQEMKEQEETESKKKRKKEEKQAKILARLQAMASKSKANTADDKKAESAS